MFDNEFSTLSSLGLLDWIVSLIALCVFSFPTIDNSLFGSPEILPPILNTSNLPSPVKLCFTNGLRQAESPGLIFSWNIFSSNFQFRLIDVSPIL